MRQNSNGKWSSWSEPDERKSTFQTLTSAASLILVMPGPSESAIWEVSQLLSSRELIRKAIFVMPCDDLAFADLFTSQQISRQERRWVDMAEIIESNLGVRFPTFRAEGCFFRANDSNKMSFEDVHLEDFVRGISKHVAEVTIAKPYNFDVEKLWEVARRP